MYNKNIIIHLCWRNRYNENKLKIAIKTAEKSVSTDIFSASDSSLVSERNHKHAGGEDQ